MRLIAVATGAIALLSLAGGTPAGAADLGWGDYSDRYRSAYEDPRYRDLYGAPPGREDPGRAWRTQAPAPQRPAQMPSATWRKSVLPIQAA